MEGDRERSGRGHDGMSRSVNRDVGLAGRTHLSMAERTHPRLGLEHQDCAPGKEAPEPSGLPVPKSLKS